MASDFTLLGPTAKIYIQVYVQNPVTGVLAPLGVPGRYGVIRGEYRQTFDNPETTDTNDGPAGANGNIATPGILPQIAAKNFKPGLYVIEATITAQRQTDVPPHKLAGPNIGNGQYIGLAICPSGGFNINTSYILPMFFVENFRASFQVSASEPQGFEFSGKGAVNARDFTLGATALGPSLGVGPVVPGGLPQNG